MKNIFLSLMAIIFLSTALAAEDPKQPNSGAVPAPAPPPKTTVKDAKKLCKEEGKEGPELLKCIKEKKGAE